MMALNATPNITSTTSFGETTSSSSVPDLPTASNPLGLLANLTPFNAGMSVVAMLVIASTAFGNVLVCVAIAREKRLQSMTNLFLMSLAIADFMVAIVVMPVRLITLITDTFPLSTSYCMAYITLSMLLLVCSLLHMCTLSVDRYLSLRYPYKYGRNKTKHCLVVKICLMWTTSAIFSSPPSVFYYLYDINFVRNGVCVMQYQPFNIVNTAVALYVPGLVMTIAYFLTRRHLMNQSEQKKSSTSLSNNNGTGVKMKRARIAIFDVESAIKQEAAADEAPPRAPEVATASDLARSVDDRQRGGTFNSGRYHKSEKRATKVVGIIIFTFGVLWTPFLLYTMVAMTCAKCIQKIPDGVLDAVFWLCYASSTANPVIYTMFNPTFRQTFEKLVNFKPA